MDADASPKNPDTSPRQQDAPSKGNESETSSFPSSQTASKAGINGGEGARANDAVGNPEVSSSGGSTNVVVSDLRNTSAEAKSPNVGSVNEANDKELPLPLEHVKKEMEYSMGSAANKNSAEVDKALGFFMTQGNEGMKSSSGDFTNGLMDRAKNSLTDGHASNPGQGATEDPNEGFSSDAVDRAKNATNESSMNNAVQRAMKRAMIGTANEAMERAAKRAMLSSANDVAGGDAIERAMKRAMMGSTKETMNRAMNGFKGGFMHDSMHRAMNGSSGGFMHDSMYRAMNNANGSFGHDSMNRAMNGTNGGFMDDPMNRAMNGINGGFMDDPMNRAMNGTNGSFMQDSVNRAMNSSNGDFMDDSMNRAMKRAMMKRAMMGSTNEAMEGAMERAMMGSTNEAMERAMKRAMMNPMSGSGGHSMNAFDGDFMNTAREASKNDMGGSLVEGSNGDFLNNSLERPVRGPTRGHMNDKINGPVKGPMGGLMNDLQDRSMRVPTGGFMNDFQDRSMRAPMGGGGMLHSIDRAGWSSEGSPINNAMGTGSHVNGAMDRAMWSPTGNSMNSGMRANDHTNDIIGSLVNKATNKPINSGAEGPANSMNQVIKNVTGNSTNSPLRNSKKDLSMEHTIGSEKQSADGSPGDPTKCASESTTKESERDPVKNISDNSTNVPSSDPTKTDIKFAANESHDSSNDVTTKMTATDPQSDSSKDKSLLTKESPDMSEKSNYVLSTDKLSEGSSNNAVRDPANIPHNNSAENTKGDTQDTSTPIDPAQGKKNNSSDSDLKAAAQCGAKGSTDSMVENSLQSENSLSTDDSARGSKKGSTNESSESAIVGAVEGTGNMSTNSALRSAMGDALNKSMNSALRSAMGDSMNKSMISTMRGAMGSSIDNPIVNSTTNAMEKSVASCKEDAVEGTIRDSMMMPMNGAAMDAAGKPMKQFTNSPMVDSRSGVTNQSMNSAMLCSMGDPMNKLTNGSMINGMGDPLCKSMKSTMNSAMRSALGDSINKSMSSALRNAMGHSFNQSISGAMRSAIGDSMNMSVDSALRSAMGGPINNSFESGMRGAMGDPVAIPMNGMRNAMGSSLSKPIDSAMRSAMGDSMNSAKESALRSAMSASMNDSGMRNALGASMNMPMNSAMRSAMGDSMNSAMENAMRNAMNGSMNNAMENAMKSAMGGSMKKAMESAVKGAMGSTLNIPTGRAGRNSHGRPLKAKNARPPKAHPVKSSKYVGVTFRSRRTKYQARIYKGNKEYNLGLFDVSADAALAYDAAHRLVREITNEKNAGSERAIIAEVESNKNSLDWLDCADEDVAKDDDPDKLNFLRPSDFRKAREKELSERNLAPQSSEIHKKMPGSYPTLAELKVIVRKEAIRIAKVVVGAAEGGSLNYKKGSKSKADSNTAGKRGPKKKKKTLDASIAAKYDDLMSSALAPSSNLDFIMNPGMGSKNMSALPLPNNSGRPPQLSNNITTSNTRNDGVPANICADVKSSGPTSASAVPSGSSKQLIGSMGKPIPNPPLTGSAPKKNPYGPPPVVPIGPVGQKLKEIMVKKEAVEMESVTTAREKSQEHRGSSSDKFDVPEQREPVDSLSGKQGPRYRKGIPQIMNANSQGQEGGSLESDGPQAFSDKTPFAFNMQHYSGISDRHTNSSFPPQTKNQNIKDKVNLSKTATSFSPNRNEMVDKKPGITKFSLNDLPDFISNRGGTTTNNEAGSNLRTNNMISGGFGASSSGTSSQDKRDTFPNMRDGQPSLQQNNVFGDGTGISSKSPGAVFDNDPWSSKSSAAYRGQNLNQDRGAMNDFNSFDQTVNNMSFGKSQSLFDPGLSGGINDKRIDFFQSNPSFGISPKKASFFEEELAKYGSGSNDFRVNVNKRENFGMSGNNGSRNSNSHPLDDQSVEFQRFFAKSMGQLRDEEKRMNAKKNDLDRQLHEWMQFKDGSSSNNSQGRMHTLSNNSYSRASKEDNYRNPSSMKQMENTRKSEMDRSMMSWHSGNHNASDNHMGYTNSSQRKYYSGNYGMSQGCDPGRNDSGKSLFEQNIQSLIGKGGSSSDNQSNLYQRKLANQGLSSLSPSTLNMIRAAGNMGPQGNERSFEQMHSQFGCDANMGGNDSRFNQQLRDALHGSQYGSNSLGNLNFNSPTQEYGSSKSNALAQKIQNLMHNGNESSSSGYGHYNNANRGRGGGSLHNDQSSLLHSFGQQGFNGQSQSHPNSCSGSGNGANGGSSINANYSQNGRYDNMAQLLNMSGSSFSPRNQGYGGNNNQTPSWNQMDGGSGSFFNNDNNFSNYSSL